MQLRKKGFCDPLGTVIIAVVRAQAKDNGTVMVVVVSEELRQFVAHIVHGVV